MTIKKLNSSGVAHHFLLAFIIVGIGVFGAYKVVLSHAQTPYKNSYSCPAQPELSLANPSKDPTCTKYVQTVVGIKATGSYDIATKVAIQKFQFAQKVDGSGCGSTVGTCDGIVGPYTWAALQQSNTKQLSAAKSTSSGKPTVGVTAPHGTIKCLTSTANTIALSIEYSKATAAKPITLYRDTTSLETYTDGGSVVPKTYIGLISAKQYKFQLRSGTTVLATGNCKTLPEPKTVTCLPGFSKNTDGDCVTPVSIVMLTCSTGSTLVTIKADPDASAQNVSIDTYYCQQDAPVDKTPHRIDGPVVRVGCTYYKGNPLVKVTDRLHTAGYCRGIHKTQATYAPCTFVNPAGKTVNEIHSAKWCAARHKEHPIAITTQQVARVTCSPGTTVDNGVSVSDATVKVHYDNASTASPFILYRNKTPIATYTDGSRTKIKLDTNLTAGTMYTYQVRSGSKVLSSTTCKTL
jgi:peptidoglycan hydrolase-like protein with peptidoglycan-binding domain